jgi:hypothetical protein
MRVIEVRGLWVVALCNKRIKNPDKKNIKFQSILLSLFSSVGLKTICSSRSILLAS